MKRFIERLLPWFDAEREAAKDRRVTELADRSERLATALRGTGEGLRGNAR